MLESHKIYENDETCKITLSICPNMQQLFDLEG